MIISFCSGEKLLDVLLLSLIVQKNTKLTRYMCVAQMQNVQGNLTNWERTEKKRNELEWGKLK